VVTREAPVYDRIGGHTPGGWADEHVHARIAPDN
jgi:hypothetical protein